MAKLIKVNEASNSCRITLHANDLAKAGFKPGDELIPVVKKGKITLQVKK